MSIFLFALRIGFHQYHRAVGHETNIYQIAPGNSRSARLFLSYFVRVKADTKLLSITICVVLVVVGCATPDCPDVLVRSADPGKEPPHVTLCDAVRISEQAAFEVIKRAERDARIYDSNLVLNLSDYRVSVSEKLSAYRVRYKNDNPEVQFIIFLGHPLHFVILVDKESGKLMDENDGDSNNTVDRTGENDGARRSP